MSFSLISYSTTKTPICKEKDNGYGMFKMKGINTLGQAMDSGGVASFLFALRDGVSHLAFPALARERNHHAGSFPLAPLGNDIDTKNR
jgi:hypothetical protein